MIYGIIIKINVSNCFLTVLAPGVSLKAPWNKLVDQYKDDLKVGDAENFFFFFFTVVNLTMKTDKVHETIMSTIKTCRSETKI